MTAGAMAGLAAVSFISLGLYRQLEHSRSELDRTQVAYAREREAATAMQSAEPVVYSLSLSRSATAASNAVKIPSSPRWIVFSIQIDASQYQEYRAILRNEAGQQIWRKDALRPSSPDTIAIPILSTALSVGAHNLSLEGQEASGRYVPVSTFPVQAKKEP
jgi:hypothetical protein